MKVLSSITVLALSATVAHAQPTERPAPDAPLSGRTALALSLGGTLASYGLLVGGMAMDGDAGTAVAITGAVGTAIAPSFGHWYAGTAWTPGAQLRVLAAGPFTFSALLAFTHPLGPERTKTEDVLYVMAAGFYVVGTLYDIIDAPLHVRRDKIEDERLQYARLVPIVSPTMAGLGLAGAW